MMIIPPHLDSWYPNEPRLCHGTPAVLFRDHRLTLPLIDLAARKGLLWPPVTLISFDRHRDALAPVNGPEPLAAHRAKDRGQAALAGLVARHLSPRDDDWIPAGMELGLIGDVVQFSSNTDLTSEPPVTAYEDAAGMTHRLFRLGRPASELSFKGALTDPGHPASSGLRELLGMEDGWSAAFSPRGSLVTDIDLDYWTIAWETHTFPFPAEVFAAEWETPGQADTGDTISAAMLVRSLINASALLTIATEPQYCGGVEHASCILDMISGPLFDGVFSSDGLMVDYPPPYPSN